MSTSCNFLQMSLVKPSFASKVPEFLTQEVSPKDKYMLEQLSVIEQTQNWLVDETVKQSSKLEEVKSQADRIETQTLKTNGRVTKLEDKNVADKEIEDETKKIVGVKQFVQKYLLNRYSLGAIFIFGLGLIRVLSDSELRDFLFKIVGL